MNLPTSLIEKAMLNPKEDDTRPGLSVVWFEKTATWRGDLVAADGFMLVALRDVGATAEDVTGPIGPEAIKAARKGGKRARRTIDLEKRPYLEVPDYKDHTEKAVFTEPEVTQFLDYNYLLAENPVDTDKVWPVLVLDAERLYHLAQAICSPYAENYGVRIYAGKNRDRAIRVEPINKPDGADKAEGLLMPLYIPKAAQPSGPDPEKVLEALRVKVRKTFSSAVSKDTHEPTPEKWEDTEIVVTTNLLRDLADVLNLAPPEQCPCCQRYRRMDEEWPVHCISCNLKWEDRAAFDRDTRRMRRLVYCPKCGKGVAGHYVGSGKPKSHTCSYCKIAWPSTKELGKTKMRLIEAKGKLPDDQYGEVYNEKAVQTEESAAGSATSHTDDVETGAAESPGGDADRDRQDGDVPVGPGGEDGSGTAGANPGPSAGVDSATDGPDSGELAEPAERGSGRGDGKQERGRPRRRRRNRSNSS